MEAQFKRLLDALTNAILALRAGAANSGGLTPAQTQQLEDATTEITKINDELATDEARIGADETTEKSDVAAIDARLSKLEVIVSGDPTASPATTGLVGAVAAVQATLTALGNDADTASGSIGDQPIPLSLSPTSGTIALKSTTPLTIAITGGTAPFKANGLPAGVTFDGTSSLVPDGTQVAGTSSISIVDSTTPTAQSATFTLTVQ